jgi:hypothetical protein
MAFPSDWKIKTRDALGVTYASVANPDFTVRFKTNVSSKSLDGTNVKNYLSEIIVNKDNDVQIGTAPNDVARKDAISVRIRVSGTAESNATIDEIIAGLIVSLPVWLTDNYMYGFEPSVLPGSAT